MPLCLAHALSPAGLGVHVESRSHACLPFSPNASSSSKKETLDLWMLEETRMGQRSHRPAMSRSSRRPLAADMA